MYRMLFCMSGRFSFFGTSPPDSNEHFDENLHKSFPPDPQKVPLVPIRRTFTSFLLPTDCATGRAEASTDASKAPTGRRWPQVIFGGWHGTSSNPAHAILRRVYWVL